MDHRDIRWEPVPDADRLDQERPVTAEPQRVRPPARPDVPEADALDQGDEVLPGPRRIEVARGFEVPDADASDQAIELPVVDEPPDGAPFDDEPR